MKNWAAILLFSALIVSRPTLAADQSGAMDFKFEQDDFRSMGMGLRQYIHADGVIVRGTASRLRAFMDANHASPGAMVSFNSPGGSLREGIEIGRLIRQREMQTNVSRIGSDGKMTSSGASCSSACSIAFLGGVIRYAPKGTSFGVHRFSSSDSTLSGADALEISQVQSSEIAEYLNYMGIRPGFITEMNAAGPNEINVLSQEQLSALRVITPLLETTWEIKANERGDVYVLGLTKDPRGTHKILFGCPPNHKGAAMIFMLDAGEAAKDVVGQTEAVQLRFNDTQIDLDNAVTRKRPSISNAYVVFTSEIDPKIMALIKSSTTMGIALVHMNKMTYSGFDADLSDGKSKILNYLRPCIH